MGRPENSPPTCPATFYHSSRQYSQVCRRVIGYQIGSVDAFGYQIGSVDAFGAGARGQGIDSYYVYGVSVTHGAPWNHIWTPS